MANLIQPNLKLQRAKEHLDSLHAELRAYVESNPGKITEEEDLERKEFIVKFTLATPPMVLAMIVGDFVACLRSALDYLVWQLALLSTDNPGREICFPVCEKDSLDTQIRITKSTFQIPDEAISIVKSLQPYQRGDDYKSARLWVLNKLWNIDKHRHITMHSSFLEIQLPPGVMKPTSAEVIDDCGIMRFPLAAKGKVRIPAKAPIGVLFGDEREGVQIDVKGLGEVYEFVCFDVFPRFEKFFS